MSDIKFTKDQENAIDGILNFISKPFDNNNYIIGLIGAGGTGKTFITNYIIKNCKLSPSVIKCTSSTHKACRVFSEALKGKQVDTIQSTFGLRLDLKLEDFDPHKPQFNPTATPKLNNVKLLLIDEASMLPAKLVTFICNKCKEMKIKVIFIGDDFQLAPVNEKESIAFKRCGKLYRLTQIVRQGDLNPISNLLKLLREDINNKTYHFLEYILKNKDTINYNEIGEGFTICDLTTFKEIIDKNFSNEEYTRNIDMYRVIAYTNSCVSGWNNYIRNNIIRNSNKSIITKNDLIMSYETIVNEFMEVVINNSEEYIINDIVNYVNGEYNLKGFLIKFQLVHGGKITRPIFVLDHTDRESLIKYYNTLNGLITDAKNATGGTRVKKWKKYYDFKKNILLAANILKKDGGILYKRDIDYGFAITSHKSQGSTYDVVFVDIKDMIYDKNNLIYQDMNDMLRRLYVACSRARKELILCI